jgi:uncharacterized ParB-like nuclease family protein
MKNYELKVEIKEIPLSLISENTGQIPDVPKNPRKITREKFDALCESIKNSPEMKVLDEVKVYPFNGRYIVISGNHRVKAYKKLGWQNVLCKVLPEDTPKEKLREYVMKENMQYAENDDALLNLWDLKELANWRVPVKIKSKKTKEMPEVEFTQVLSESHNYIVLYFDDEVDWLQAQTLLELKPVRLMNTVKGSDNVHAKETGIGRVLRGVDVFNRLLKENRLGSISNQNKTEDEDKR